jgi:multiple sugar transport system permease protein
VLASLFLSFTHYEVVRAPTWVGLENYQRVLGDRTFHAALRNTIYYLGISLPSSLVISLFLAIALNQRIRGIVLFRTAFFLPVVSSQVAISLLFLWLYSNHGLLNFLLSLVGIQRISWLTSDMALNSLIVVSVWQSLGTLIVYWLAGLQGVPQELYEAADIDGAGWWTRLRWITVPLLSPVTFFLIVLGVIGSFQVFTTALIMTDGGPANATMTIALYIYHLGFRFFQMGYGSAIAYILFVILLILTLIQWRLQSRWVHYE